MSQPVDHTGERFGRLTVEARDMSRGWRYWFCRCDCGTIISALMVNLQKGQSKSCGCLARELSSARNRTHGMSDTITYRCWRSMVARCNNPKNCNFSNYGSRGISVCERWL